MAIIYFPSGKTTRQSSDWIAVDPNSGSGDGSLSVSADAHTGRVARNHGTASVPAVAVTAGGVAKKFYVTQAAKEEFVTIAVSGIASASGQTLTVSGKSNSSKLMFYWSSNTFNKEITTYTAAGSTATNSVALQADPGAWAEYSYSFKLEIPRNLSNSVKEGLLWAVSNNAFDSRTVSIQQYAESKLYVGYGMLNTGRLG